MMLYEVKGYISKIMKFENFLFLFLFVLILNVASAEIIDNQKIINKEFGSWTVSCKEDVMSNENSCRLFTDILDGSTIFVNPNNEANKVVIVSREVVEGTKIIFRIDKNNLIESDFAKNDKYNVVEMNVENKKQLLEQMKTGNTLYVRLNTKDNSNKRGVKQITARFNLADFSKAIIYYNSIVKTL